MDIFQFDKEQITRHIEYELKTTQKFKEPLNYVIKGLQRLKNSMTIESLDKKIDLNKVKENKGKNYSWSTFTYGNVTLVVRRYQQHLTIFTKVVKNSDANERRHKIEYGAFTLKTNFEKFGDKHDEMMDKYWNNPFIDLNVIIKNLLKLLLEKDGSVHWVWNSATLKRPDHVEIKLIFSDNTISSIDNFAFCMEELSTIYLELFAESTMIQKLKEYKNKVGEKLNKYYTIGKVITKRDKDDYYHSVGMTLIKNDSKESNFQDIYSLTRYYFDSIFQDKIYFYQGEVYVQGGNLKVGEAVTYKEEDLSDEVFLFKETYPKENFIPLVKY